MTDTEKRFFTMIPQSAVKQTMFRGDSYYNASWDYAISPEGRHYFSVCAEWLDGGGKPGLDALLYEYCPKNGALKRLVNVNTDIFTYPRTIRPTKIHTCISFMEDGKLIMNIHTTSPSPVHPRWMPEAYYAHPHEGFPGSNMIIYDPKTGHVEDMGIPVRYESIYGAKYDPVGRAYYCSGYFRGHGYRIDLDTHAVTDYGQITEFGSYLHHTGPDANIYISTRSGSLLRYNVYRKEPEYLGVSIPVDPNYPEFANRKRNVMAYAVNAPDGKGFFFCAHTKNRNLYYYDLAANQIRTVGSTVPAWWLAVTKGSASVFGMDFDEEGVLWYGLTPDGTCAHLIRWDVLNGGEPVDHGLMGVPEHNCTCFCEAYIRDGIFYAASACHPTDPPSILEVDLQKIRRNDAAESVIAMDKRSYWGKEFAKCYPGGSIEGNTNAVTGGIASYEEPDVPGGHALSDGILHAKPKNNQFMLKTERKYVTKLWKKIPVEASSVVEVSYDDDGTVTVISGNAQSGYWHHRISKGKLLSSCRVDYKEKTAEAVREKYREVIFAAPAGRSWLACASCEAPLADGSMLVGTEAGTLAVVKNGKAYNLGSPVSAGRIHALCASADQRTVYGVAGDPDGIGIVFSYSMEAGLVSHGMIYFMDGDGEEGLGISTEPTSIAFSPDNTSLAIGASDRLGCVYEYYFEDRKKWGDHNIALR